MPDIEVASANRPSLPTSLSRRLVESRLAGRPSAADGDNARCYSIADALPILCKQPEAGAVRRIQAFRERESQAKADLAELKLMAKAGELCLLSDAKLWWSDERIAIRQIVERADYMRESAKHKLLTQMAAVKTEAPEACEDI